MPAVVIKKGLSLVTMKHKIWSGVAFNRSKVSGFSVQYDNHCTTTFRHSGVHFDDEYTVTQRTGWAFRMLQLVQMTTRIRRTEILTDYPIKAKVMCVNHVK